MRSSSGWTWPAGSERPMPRLSHTTTRTTSASRSATDENGVAGSSYIISTLLNQPGIQTSVVSPARNSRYASRTSPLRAYRTRPRLTRSSSYFMARPGAVIGFVVSAVMIVLAMTPIPPNWPWDIPLVILSVFTSVGTVVCGLLWFDNPHFGPRPELLEIIPFSRAENLRLMQHQVVEPFQAACTCPGCGHSTTHRIREPAENEPHWAAATRHCAVCEREWAQA